MVTTDTRVQHVDFVLEEHVVMPCSHGRAGEGVRRWERCYGCSWSGEVGEHRAHVSYVVVAELDALVKK